MLGLIPVCFIILLILLFYLKFMSGSVFGVSLQKRQYSGFFFFYNFIVFIIPSSILLNIYPIETFWVAFKVDQGKVFFTTIVVLLSYFLMLLVLFFVYRLQPKYFRYESPELNCKDMGTYRRFVIYSVFASIVLIVLVWLILGVGHAFFISFTLDQSISQARMALTENIVTKFLKYYFIIVTPLLVTLIASPAFKGKPLSRVLLMFGALILGAWGGSKGPLLVLFLVYLVTWATFSNYKVSWRSLFGGGLLLLVLIFLVYLVVLFQYPHLNNVSGFFGYFYQRVFIAQMIGVYEQFSLGIANSLYILHGIPFASFLFDYPVFHKDLMMITEDRVDASAIGIKNTYFIAEAHAMGGWFFILPAVVIYSINFSFSYFLMLFALNKLLVNNPPFNKVIVAVFLFSYLGVTGGFSDLMLFKIMIMLFILLAPVFLLAYFARFIFVVRKNN